jgi:transposase
MDAKDSELQLLARYGQNDCVMALGRRNWLFADTVSGAKASAHLYSLVQTARANELDPHAYLRRLFTELPAAQSVTHIEALLPFRSVG